MNAPTRQLNLPSRLPSVPEAGLAPSLERRRLRFYLAQIAMDVALLLGCFWTATHLYFDDGPRGQPMLAVHLMLPIFISIALYNRTYSLQSLANWKLGSRKALVAILIAAALLNFSPAVGPRAREPANYRCWRGKVPPPLRLSRRCGDVRDHARP
jgi:hypothetical protein